MPPKASSCFGMISDEGGGSTMVRLLLAAARRAWYGKYVDIVP